MYTDPCTANSASCDPNGKCVLSDNADAGWCCVCDDGFISTSNGHACTESKSIILIYIGIEFFFLFLIVVRKTEGIS